MIAEPVVELRGEALVVLELGAVFRQPVRGASLSPGTRN
jgi:hypothetical protein